MFNIKLAEINFSIENKYEYIYNISKEYITEDSAEFMVSATEYEIMAEATEACFHKGYLESLAIYRKIAEKINFKKGFLMHGAVIDVNNCGIAFLAKSGTGKTTHLKLWQKLLGNNVKIINGDKPLIRIKDEKIFAYGTPWAGKENFQTNAKTELKKICFIERSEKNLCIPLKKSEAFFRLINQIYMPKNVLCEIKELTEKADFYLIRCNTDISAAETAYQCIIGSKSEL